MARKAYSDEERAQVKEALMVTMIRCIADRGLIHSSIDVLCGKVGISKTFFYSFFSSKEELVLHALRYQQPRLLDYARQLMEDPALSWRAGVETFLKNCCYGAESGVAVLSIEEEQQARRCLSEENFQALAAGAPLPFRREFSGLPTGPGQFLWKTALHLWPSHRRH